VNVLITDHVTAQHLVAERPAAQQVTRRTSVSG
jgi:hypothetical protein